MIFISYSRADIEVVQRLSADLDRFGHEAWYDTHLDGGAEWWNEILGRIRGCTVFIFVASGSSSASQPCRQELAYAFALERPVLPIVLQADVESSVPPELLQIQALGYSEGTKEEVADLIKAVSILGIVRPLPDPLPPVPDLPRTKYSQIRQEILANGLDGDQQESLLLRIRQLWKLDSDGNRTRSLLLELAERKDLLASVAPGIDELLTEIDSANSTLEAPGKKRVPLRATGIEMAALVLGLFSLFSLFFGQLASEFYTDGPAGYGAQGWGAVGPSGQFPRWPYMALPIMLAIGLIVYVFDLWRRAAVAAVIGAGTAIIGTTYFYVARATASSGSIDRFGAGFGWTVAGGACAIVAGSVLLDTVTRQKAQ